MDSKSGVWKLHESSIPSYPPGFAMVLVSSNEVDYGIYSCVGRGPFVTLLRNDERVLQYLDETRAIIIGELSSYLVPVWVSVAGTERDALAQVEREGTGVTHLIGWDTDNPELYAECAANLSINRRECLALLDGCQVELQHRHYAATYYPDIVHVLKYEPGIGEMRVREYPMSAVVALLIARAYDFHTPGYIAGLNRGFLRSVSPFKDAVIVELASRRTYECFPASERIVLEGADQEVLYRRHVNPVRMLMGSQSSPVVWGDLRLDGTPITKPDRE